MSKFVLGLIAVVLSTHVTAQSETVTEELEVAINQLLEETGALEMGEQMAEVFVAQMSETLRQSRPDLPPVAFEIIREETMIVVREEMERGSFQSMIVPIYAQFFTLEEIEEMLVFYRSPVGKKSVEVMPSLTQQSMQAGERWGMLVGPTIGTRITERLAAEGIELE